MFLTSVTAIALTIAFDSRPTRLPPETAAAFTDRTPAVAEAEADALRDALARAVPASDGLTVAADAHATVRRTELAAAGEPAEDFSTVRDLLRFPNANRGQPVTLAGTVLATHPLAVAFGPATWLLIAPTGEPSAAVAALVPTAVLPPGQSLSPGTRVTLSGFFLKLAELPPADPPGGDTASPRTVPLLAVGSVALEPERSGLLPPASLWKSVRHKSFGMTAAERTVYQRLLEAVTAAPPAALAAAAAAQQARRKAAMPLYAQRETFPTFVDLFRYPEAYQGQAVTLSGVARRIVRFPADEGTSTLYEAWVFTEDSESNPAVIIAASAAPDLPVGEDVQVPVRVTGGFFKITAYRARDTPRIAPMIVAGRLEPLPVRPTVTPRPWFALVLVAGLALLVGFAALRRPRRTARPRFPPEPDQPLTFPPADVSNDDRTGDTAS